MHSHFGSWDIQRVPKLENDIWQAKPYPNWGILVGKISKRDICYSLEIMYVEKVRMQIIKEVLTTQNII